MTATTSPPRLIRPLRDAVLLAVAVLAVVVLSQQYFTSRAHVALSREVRESLEEIALSAAAMVDADLHARLAATEPGDQGLAQRDYARAVAPLRAIQAALPRVRFIYTVVRRGPGVAFVLDATEPGDRDGDGVEDHSGLLEPYAQPDPAMLRALAQGVVCSTDQPFADKWGRFMTGYAPIRDARGNLAGVVGIDMSADRYDQEMAVVTRASRWSLGIGAVLALAVAAGVFLVRRQAALAQHRRLQAQQALRTILDSTYDAIIAQDAQGRVVEANAKALEMLGVSHARALELRLPQDALLGRSPVDAPPGRWQEALQGQAQVFEWQGRRLSDGQEFPMEVFLRRVELNGKQVVLANIRDISERKRAEQQLRDAADTDRLCGLPNRSALMRRLQQAVLVNLARPQRRFAVMFLDFDRFKMINDSLGHAQGDRLLIQAAGRMVACLADRADRLPAGGPGPYLARLGGDEFVLLLEGLSDLAQATRAAEALARALAPAFDLNGYEAHLSCSIGIVFGDGGYRSAEEVLRDADTAMYRAKHAGRDRHVVFDQHMHQEVREALALEQDLRHALERGQLRLNYQPIVSLESGGLIGFEALLRWNHPTRGMVPPDRFIALAEETGLIVPIGRWVLDETCRQLARWQRQSQAATDLTINVNLSKRQLLEPALLTHVAESLRNHGVAPRNLKIEITESAVMEEADRVVPALQALRELGIKLCMDDFGTGTSSLSCLSGFPIDVLKIDRAFIRQMTDSRPLAAMVYAVITLAHNLRMTVVAEGVESDDQLTQLQALECDHGQGYLFARPLDAPEAEKYVRTCAVRERRAA